jgi:hypothetical protein
MNELREHMALMAELDRLRVETAELRRKARAQNLMDAANARMGQMFNIAAAMRNAPEGLYARHSYAASPLSRCPGAVGGIGEALFGVRI